MKFTSHKFLLSKSSTMTCATLHFTTDTQYCTTPRCYDGSLGAMMGPCCYDGSLVVWWVIGTMMGHWMLWRVLSAMMGPCCYDGSLVVWWVIGTMMARWCYDGSLGAVHSMRAIVLLMCSQCQRCVATDSSQRRMKISRWPMSQSRHCPEIGWYSWWVS